MAYTIDQIVNARIQAYNHGMGDVVLPLEQRLEVEAELRRPLGDVAVSGTTAQEYVPIIPDELLK